MVMISYSSASGLVVGTIIEHIPFVSSANRT